MVSKEWYLLIGGQKEGPYTLLELRNNRLITPDTLIWKEGFRQWVAIRYVPELKILFQDEKEEEPPADVVKEGEAKSAVDSQETTLAIRYEPPYKLYFWLLIVILMVCYTIYRFYTLNV